MLIILVHGFPKVCARDPGSVSCFLLRHVIKYSSNAAKRDKELGHDDEYAANIAVGRLSRGTLDFGFAPIDHQSLQAPRDIALPGLSLIERVDVSTAVG